MDYRFSANPKVSHTGVNSFSVSDLVEFVSDRPPIWNHRLTFYCEYCHREITVMLVAPRNIHKPVEEEACRIANIHHLRTEHGNKPKGKKISN
jgi:hypothetical protein